MRLEWTVFAQRDRDLIFDYIETDNPRAAVSIDERIGVQAARLIRFPESGRPGRVEGTRELVVNRTPYIIVYRIAGSRFASCGSFTERNSGQPNPNKSSPNRQSAANPWRSSLVFPYST
ncbi:MULTISPECIES: type II toxin-antitoxin system RelE/ParE family toxin [Acidobacteriaceae]|uniref:type II toxin-antitoxin system RelE/ParE family toxin n=1 Tax=Acidobacteriaceae TaxID=204434 RepID=UPI0020B15EAD|nr:MULTISPECIES: type II toxin-antitoxin system RelE/ParE family toxin [Acidobacteriaceae]MDW5267971.1 type II toxin-antitoxin system RelE/ParE family toxin [Edaphobacter sp.]